MRSVRHAGLPISAATRSLSGGEKWRPGFFALRSLVDVATALKMEPDEVLWNHTVFPYATAFFQQPLLDRALRAALSKGEAAIGMGVVTQSVSDHSRQRRLCRLCVKEDVERWGESYWHRAHNLPGVLVCHRHRTALTTTAVSTVAKRWCAELPPEVAVVSTQWRPTRFAKLLAQASVDTLTKPSTRTDTCDAAWYRERLASKGLVSPSRAIDSTRLANWVSAWLGTAPGRFGLRETDESLSWLALMVRPGNTAPFVPLKHHIFQAALAAQPHRAEPFLDYSPQGFLGRDKSTFDARLALEVRKLIRRHIDLGERVRVRDVLAEAGCWGQYRHDPDSYPRVAAAVRWLKRSSACMRPNWGKGASAG